MKGIVKFDVNVACDPRTEYKCNGGECSFIWPDDNGYEYCCRYSGRGGCGNGAARFAADQLAEQNGESK